MSNQEARDEREAQGWAEAEAYAIDTPPSQRAETMDAFMTGWRTADRTRKHPEPEWEYGVIGPTGRMVNNGDYRVQQTHRRRKAGPWEPVE